MTSYFVIHDEIYSYLQQKQHQLYFNQSILRLP